MFINLLIFIVASLLQYGLIVLSDRCRPRIPTTSFTINEGSLTTTIVVADFDPGYQPGDSLLIGDEEYRIVCVNDSSVTLDRQVPLVWREVGGAKIQVTRGGPLDRGYKERHQP